ncbi:alpha/beta fold hydrolase [Roseisolibacter sp. H3M3-2]|uniref:esterase/lipase family protein n=1 Tax=Roseisolibacter sp. H3M3-2 TaxID=3031323 RepID=UPI0023DC18FD|nr:alpha/beta fold hydrolase [Roseisolibacter sp. H3M3-2]
MSRVSGVRGTVLLVHGLGRGPWSMWPLARAARRHGYAVRNWGYASRRGDAAALAAPRPGELARLADAGAGPVHVVTHSLGGILVRACLARAGAARQRAALGRVVMLAPPNHGSELAERLREGALPRRVLGPAMAALGTGPEAVPRRLGALPAGVEVGVIAGDRAFAPLLGRWLPAPHDGKVSVASARVDGMADFAVVRRGHTFLMWAPEVRRDVFAFLAGGRFAARPDATPDASARRG